MRFDDANNPFFFAVDCFLLLLCNFLKSSRHHHPLLLYLDQQYSHFIIICYYIIIIINNIIIISNYYIFILSFPFPKCHCVLSLRIICVSKEIRVEKTGTERRNKDIGYIYIRYICMYAYKTTTTSY